MVAPVGGLARVYPNYVMFYPMCKTATFSFHYAAINTFTVSIHQNEIYDTNLLTLPSNTKLSGLPTLSSDNILGVPLTPVFYVTY